MPSTTYFPNNTIQHAGVILGIGGIANHVFKYEPRGSSGYFGRACLEQDLSCVTAGCMAVRKEAYLSIGGMNEALAVAFNDVDFCIRLRQLAGASSGHPPWSYIIVNWYPSEDIPRPNGRSSFRRKST